LSTNWRTENFRDRTVQAGEKAPEHFWAYHWRG